MKTAVRAMVCAVLLFMGLCAGGASSATASELMSDAKYQLIVSNLPTGSVGAFSTWSVDVDPRERRQVVFPSVGYRMENARRVSPYFIIAVLVVHFGEVLLPSQVDLFVSETLTDRAKLKIDRSYNFMGGDLNLNAKFPRMVGIKYTFHF